MNFTVKIWKKMQFSFVYLIAFILLSTSSAYIAA